MPKRVAKKEEKEEVLELKAPSNLNANYDAASASVTLNWSHEAPDPDLVEGQVEFIVSASAGGGEMKEMTRTTDNSLTFSGAAEYNVYISALLQQSASSTVLPLLSHFNSESKKNRKKNPIEDVEEEPEFEDDNGETETPGDPNPGNNQGNEGNNGNQGNQGNNGNQGKPGE